MKEISLVHLLSHATMAPLNNIITFLFFKDSSVELLSVLGVINAQAWVCCKLIIISSARQKGRNNQHFAISLLFRALRIPQLQYVKAASTVMNI